MKPSNVIFLPFNDEEALADYFEKSGDEICAVIVEGIQGVGGINVANESFLQLIRKLCDEHEVSVYCRFCSMRIWQNR